LDNLFPERDELLYLEGEKSVRAKLEKEKRDFYMA